MKPISELYYEQVIKSATVITNHFDSASGMYLTAHFDSEDIYVRTVDTFMCDISNITEASGDCVSFFETSFEELEGALGEALLDMIASNFEEVDSVE